MVKIDQAFPTYGIIRPSGLVGNGTADDTAALAAAIAAIPSAGGKLVLPPGNFRITSSITRTLNSGGVSGWGVTIEGAGWGDTVILVDCDEGEYGIEITGPSSTWASHFTMRGIQFKSSTQGKCHGLKLAGLSFATVECYFQQCNVGLDLESVLVSQFRCTFYQNDVGAWQRESGFFSGSWGASGCNANKWSGSFNANLQYGLISDTFQNIKIDSHCERNGDENISGGGVSDTDRGGFKFINPEGSILVQSSFEDNGDVEDSDEGKGPIYVITDADNANINWTLSLDGAYFKRTADGPKSIVYIDNHASAGDGALVWNGSHLENNGSYSVSASNPTFNLTASGQNLSVSMIGGVVDGGATEFAYSSDVSYSIIGIPDITPGGVCQQFILPAGGSCRYLLDQGSTGWAHTGDTDKTALKTVAIPAGAMGTKGRVETEYTFTGNGTANKTGSVEFGGTAYGSTTFTTNLVYTSKRYVANKNSASSQKGGPVGGQGGWAAGTAAVTSSVNTASAVNLIFYGQLASGSETITLEDYQVWVVYKA